MKKQINRNGLLLAALVCTALLMMLSGCASLKMNSNYQNTGFAMGTVISQNMYGGDEELAEQILQVVSGLEQKISWRIEGSETARMNEAAATGEPIKVSDEMAGWLMYCQEVYRESGGKLDVTVGPAARLWDIGGENPRIPEKEELESALEKIGMDGLKISGTEVTFSNKDGQIDLGAVGKGIACDQIFSYLEQHAPAVNGTFSVGGSVLVYGAKPRGQEWKIGIRNPLGDEGEYMGAIVLDQKEEEWQCISTSGDYEKFFEEDGVRYHHILDPGTGAPASSDLISVTIISESGFLSDALSTACFIAGKDEGLKLAESFQAEAIVITKEREVFLTDGAEKNFELLDNEFSIK